MAQFTNQAQLTYNNFVTNSNIAVGEILEVLSATKTAVQDTYGRDDRVTYLVSIVNSGTTAQSQLTLTDNLGAYSFGTMNPTQLVPLTYVEDTVKYYINGVLQPTPPVIAGPPLVISNITIPAGGNVLIAYEAQTNQYAPITTGARILNRVTISGNCISDITVEETVLAESEPLLSITKSVSPVPVTENGVLTYTFVIQNTGNTAATVADAAVITDTFDPILTNLSVTFNGTTWTEGANYTYNVITGLFATLPGQITVPAATYTQNPVTGVWTTNPGVSTLVVSGVV
ncbi:MAG: hypothetical protein K6G30_07040 [Acetatifactor sp.]|nr:hypothetical protein [Acetatifactor sp.]